MPAGTDAIKRRLRADLLIGMRARQQVETGVIRDLLAALDNAEALPVDPERPASLQARFGDQSAEATRRDLSISEVATVIAAEVQKRLDAAAEFERLGQPAQAQVLREEAQIAGRYVP